MGKVVTLNWLIKKIKELKKNGKTVVFTNGVFDILHVGHVRYLKDAKSKGDILIVGINSDQSVKKIKGKKRPIVPANERAEIIASLEVVDYVLIFEETSPAEVIIKLKPHIHCKGSDYKSPATVPESQIVESYGGKTLIVGDPKRHATTDIIRKICSLHACSDSTS